jgi:Mg2+ and Co2+ transporter CorA
MKTCPICGNESDKYSIDAENLQFLTNLANEKKMNPALSITRMMWTNIPKIGLTADTREAVDELARTLIENTQNQLATILAPMKMFIDTFPKMIEELPEDIRTDVKKEFQETRIRIESEFKNLREATPTFKDTLNAMQAMTDKLHEVTERKMDSIKEDVNEKFKETLERMGFPEPEQMRLLSQLMPAILPLLEELLRFQKVPSEKGKQGELELIKQLREYYPEDESEPIGGPGDTDILAIPRFNGLNLTYKILIESKKNGSGWNRSFIQQTRTHMKLRGERFAILAVDKMPQGANSFLFEQCAEGVVLVTDREYFRVAYGSLRASLIALQQFNHKEVDFGKLFADQKISEAIKEAHNYCEWARRIREKARRIETNADGIGQDIDELDKHLRRTLNELQARINNAINRIAPTEYNGLSSNCSKTLEVPLSGK